MDQSSSPPAASVSTSNQPTYTTAGTIYNPSSSQPLQPPARRGRSFKWATGGPHSDLGLFPKSVPASLALKSGSGSGRLTTTASFQHYTPLQQNYDRAVSPFSDLDHQLARMPPPQAPRLRPADNVPLLPSSLFPALSQERLLYADTSDDSDEESDLGMDPLMNMTVKSLHNLASYPNPNQKKAQKALLRGAKPNLGSLTAASRMNASPSYPTFGSFEPSREVGDRPLSMLRSTLSDTSGLRRSYMDSRSRLSEFGRAGTSISAESRLPSPAPDVADFVSFTHSTTLASGPGAPRPLTAGPPGQRQYRPSTFESTFKALHTNPHRQGQTFDEDEVLSVTQQTILHPGMDDSSFTSDFSPSQFGISSQLHLASDSNAPMRPIGYERGATSSFETPRDDMFTTAENSAYVSSYSDMIAQSTWGWQPERQQENCHPFSSVAHVGFKNRWTDEEIEARNERINRYWYAGTGLLGEIPDDAVVTEPQRKKKKNIYGAVGDGRPTKKDRPDTVLDQSSSTRIGETNKQMPASEHAQSLLDWALTSMLRNGADRTSQRPPSPNHDQEPDNRTSFFGNTFQRMN